MHFAHARPRLTALLLGLAAEALFAFRLAIPHALVFDEAHYIPAARTLLALAGAVNIEHPLLGKATIAAGIALFGDNPIGWRLFSTFAASAVVAGIFALTWLLYARQRPAIVASLLVLLNFTVFVQARIAMLDGFMAALVVWALVAAVSAMRAPPRRVHARWALAAALLGLAAGTKWVAVPYVAFLAAGFALAKWRNPQRWAGLGIASGWLVLAGVSGAVYLATFAPAFFYHSQPLTLAALLPFQATMYAQQAQILPPHPYQSAWWSWPLELRPIWYFYTRADGAQRGILLLGNPAVMSGGLVAVIACLAAWARDGERRAGALALLWLGSWLIWAAIPKTLGFYYYYYLSSIWLGPVISAALHHYRARARYSDEAAVTAAAALFVYFYPILAATPLGGPLDFTRWMWLKGWV